MELGIPQLEESVVDEPLEADIQAVVNRTLFDTSLSNILVLV